MSDKPYVLVVDDDPDVLGTLCRALTREGYEATGVSSGYEAFDQLQKRKPNLIILDVMMPGTDGIELCKMIRHRGDTMGTPVLILSARGDADSVMRGMEAGANDYLPKPILHHDLVSKVRSILTQVSGA